MRFCWSSAKDLAYVRCSTIDVLISRGTLDLSPSQLPRDFYKIPFPQRVLISDRVKGQSGNTRRVILRLDYWIHAGGAYLRNATHAHIRTHSQERRQRKAISLGRSDTEYITRINVFALRLSVVEICLGASFYMQLYRESTVIWNTDGE